MTDSLSPVLRSGEREGGEQDSPHLLPAQSPPRPPVCLLERQQDLVVLREVVGAKVCLQQRTDPLPLLVRRRGGHHSIFPQDCYDFVLGQVKPNKFIQNSSEDGLRHVASVRRVVSHEPRHQALKLITTNLGSHFVSDGSDVGVRELLPVTWVDIMKNVGGKSWTFPSTASPQRSEKLEK